MNHYFCSMKRESLRSDHSQSLSGAQGAGALGAPLAPSGVAQGGRV